jgi:hypothetical protein
MLWPMAGAGQILSGIENGRTDSLRGKECRATAACPLTSLRFAPDFLYSAEESPDEIAAFLKQHHTEVSAGSSATWDRVFR